jgi:hypothetical protein
MPGISASIEIHALDLMPVAKVEVEVERSAVLETGMLINTAINSTLLTCF